MTLKRRIDPDADVYGFFNDQLLSTGWGVLEFKAGYGGGSRRRISPDLTGSRRLPTSELFKAAGYFEGYLKAHRILQQTCNTFERLAGNI